jgi:hypothetical protein
VEFNEPVGNLDPTKVEITNGAGASTGKTISREDSRTFRITVGGLSHDGDVTASILAGASKDEAGNPTLAASHTITYNHLPTAPSAPDLAAGSDTGVSDSDNITKTTTGLVFKGTGEVGSTVQLVKGSTVLGSDTVNASGQWTITVSSALSEGDNVLFAQAVDSNSTIVGPSLTITIDTTPPPAPSAPDLRGDDDTGSSNTDNYTKAETIRLQGTAVTGTQITLYDGDTQLTTVTAVDGAYVFTLAPSSGPHSYTVRGAQDLAGNVSSTASSPLNVTIDREVTLSTLNATPNGTGATKSWTISGTREGTLTGNTPTVTVEKRNGQSNNYGTDASSAGSVTGSPNFSVALTLAQNASNATTSQVSATNYRVTVTQTDLAGNTLSRVIYLG